MQSAMEDQRLVERILEICALPALLPAGINHLDDGALQSTQVDTISIALRGKTPPLRGLPL